MAHRFGILHPGEMGVFVAATIKNSGYPVYWNSDGRSQQTRARAEKCGLQEIQNLRNLCQTCDVLISVCPPHAAESVADQVLAHDFLGLYVDANAISPQRTMNIGQKIIESGSTFIDGGIIGGPAWESGRTMLYLSGIKANEIASCFSAGPLGVHVIGDKIGDASALKMCFAAYTKGTTALICGILATAEALGVREHLEQEWAQRWPGFDDEAKMRSRRVTAKAWRFAGEMKEISATFSQAGLPGGFHAAAADLYQRLASFKDSPALPSYEEVLVALVNKSQS